MDTGLPRRGPGASNMRGTEGNGLHTMNRLLAVGMYTTVGPRCGIADYTRDLSSALGLHVSVTIVPICRGNLNPFATVLAGLRLGRNDVAHIQHTYSFFGVDPLTYTLLIRLLLRSIRAPIVLTAHTVRESGPARYEGGLGSALANVVGAPAWQDTETFRRPDAIIVHTAYHKERLAARGLPADRIHVIPPGVPAHVRVEPAEVSAFCTRFGFPSDRPVIGVFGFLEGSKRFLDLLNAVAALPGRPTLLVAGGPRLPNQRQAAAKLRTAAERLGIDDRLVITGYLQAAAVPVALEAMDLVVVPYATDESMSYSLHRALGQFRPVVATDLPTLREVEARGHCLALVPPADPVTLHKTLAALLEDVPARGRLVAAAKEYAAREGPAVAAARTARVYACIHAAHG